MDEEDKLDGEPPWSPSADETDGITSWATDDDALVFKVDIGQRSPRLS